MHMNQGKKKAEPIPSYEYSEALAGMKHSPH